MKKYIFNIAAIILAAGASAFTTTHDLNGKKLVSYKWFKINTAKSLTQTVANSDATYLGESEAVPTSDDCTDANVRQCISGFNSSQVNSSNQIVGSQMPAQLGHTRN